ncbi:MAG: alpha-2-macroglobulin family protein, partial [Pseudomonadota bacterium]
GYFQRLIGHALFPTFDQTGAYVLASLIRPLDTAAGLNPARAMGIVHAGIAPGARALDANFVSADRAEPRETHEAVLQVAGATPGAEVWATVSAVDLGILNVTGFEAPDPMGHYLGQRSLGVELRDVYGRLIDGMGGTQGRLRQGGDGGASQRKSPPPTEELVASFSGPLRVGADGLLRVPVEVPDFNGTIRLAAVVWSAEGVGQARQDVTVRDPIVLSANLPRFLAPGDQALLSLDLAHVDGPAGALTIAAEGAGLSSAPQTLSLAAGGRAQLDLPLVGGEVGDHAIRVSMTTPDGRVLTKDLTLGVRANDPEIARQSRLELAAGGVLTLNDSLLAGLQLGTGRITVAAGHLAQFDVPGLLTALDTYPYGCTEQITSRALPLLYYSALAEDLDLARGDLSARLEDAVAAILANQARSGGFGLWRPEGGDLWLDAYVTDFLSRARAEGVEVPATAFEVALDNLANRVNGAPDFENGGEGLAYALLVLAREGAANIGDLRYYADAKADDFATPLALAQLGAGLALYGDPGRADAMFRAAGAQLSGEEAPGDYRVDYGSAARDRAAVLTLAVEAGSMALDQSALAARVAQAAGPGRARASTQERLWTVLAAHALAEGQPPTLTIDGVKRPRHAIAVALRRFSHLGDAEGRDHQRHGVGPGVRER